MNKLKIIFFISKSSLIESVGALKYTGSIQKKIPN
jgi:hypothetical protein